MKKNAIIAVLVGLLFWFGSNLIRLERFHQAAAEYIAHDSAMELMAVQDLESAVRRSDMPAEGAALLRLHDARKAPCLNIVVREYSAAATRYDCLTKLGAWTAPLRYLRSALGVLGNAPAIPIGD